MLKLQNKIEVIIPKKDNNKKEISDKAIKTATNEITKEVGGCSITEIFGQWYSDNENRIMQDENIIIEWYYQKPSSDIVENLNIIIFRLIIEHNQEAVSLKVNGVLYIIFKDDIIGLRDVISTLL